jgi:hypothetical protein
MYMKYNFVEKYEKGDNIHGVQLCVVKHKKRGDNVHEVQLCVVKYEKEVTRYLKYSCV